jgi:hypothetical protein
MVIVILLEQPRLFEIFSILFWRLVAVALAIPVFLLCKTITRFDNATEAILRAFVAKLTEPGAGADRGADSVLDPSRSLP